MFYNVQVKLNDREIRNNKNKNNTKMWRPMLARDLKKVHAISLAQWGTMYYESVEVLQNKLEFYPDGCYVYEREGVVCGYVFSHPWSSTNVPRLNTMLPKPDQSDCYYIHDIVLMPECRGNLIAAEILELLVKHHPLVCVVAPSPGQHYWKKYYGFEKTNVRCEYGVHMRRVE